MNVIQNQITIVHTHIHTSAHMLRQAVHLQHGGQHMVENHQRQSPVQSPILQHAQQAEQPRPGRLRADHVLQVVGQQRQQRNLGGHARAQLRVVLASGRLPVASAIRPYVVAVAQMDGKFRLYSNRRRWKALTVWHS